MTVACAFTLVPAFLLAARIGMRRRPVLPTWAWVAVAVSMPAHLVCLVVLGNLPLDAVAWGLMALGLAGCARHLLRLSDDAWDLPPLPPRCQRSCSPATALLIVGFDTGGA